MLSNTETSVWSSAPIREQRQEVWVTNTQVNFCARAYPTVPSGHPDAPILSVLGAFLRNGFLHRSIREQGGAYGGGASHDPNIAAFRFFSYRDPRLADTLADFDASLHWLMETDHEALKSSPLLPDLPPPKQWIGNSSCLWPAEEPLDQFFVD